MVSNFSNIRLPEYLSLGAVGGPEYSTIVHSISNGYEERIMQWQHPKYRFNLSAAIDSKQELEELIAFFIAHKGKAISFRFKDWNDYKCVGQKIEPMGGMYQLYKTYKCGDIEVKRIISKPVEGTVSVYADGIKKDVVVDYSTGVLLFSGVAGKNISVDFEFDVHARFDADELPISADIDDLANVRISVVEVR
ncbi:MAG: DUF2460 domain-containing protein [Alphaproteobacteria bacterium]|jgi:uncharacterized protein (TIGR02217 family)|nr:DUF2460 domain-containing protein [Candidatus Jidaibacter sp.]